MAPGPMLITGGTGQLAATLFALARAQSRPARLVGRPEFDFDRPDAIPALLAAVAPSAIVNAAAYTAVDRAESEPEAAARANATGPEILARYCAGAGIPLIHISTDYVFDGNKGAPYTEADPTNPTGVYGATKLAGEQAILAACPHAIVLRTAWVYAATGRNFVLTMLNAARKTNALRVVADQIGNPTATQDIAGAIVAILDRIAADGLKPEFAGIYHAAGSGSTSWHGLAEAVFRNAARHGGPQPTVTPITTADWPTPVRRPPDSRLDCTRLAQVFGIRMPEWEKSLAETVDAVFCDVPIPAAARPGV